MPRHPPYALIILTCLYCRKNSQFTLKLLKTLKKSKSRFSCSQIISLLVSLLTFALPHCKKDHIYAVVKDLLVALS